MLYPIGRYNLNFDLCAGFLDLLLLVSLLRKRNLQSGRIRVFVGMVALMAIAAFGEFSTGALRNTGHTAGVTPALVTAIAHFAYISVEYMLALYILQLTGRGHGLSGARILLLSAPEIVFTLALLLPWLRSNIFYYDEAGVYHRGSLYILYVLVVAFYTIYCLVLILLYRRAIQHDFIYVLGLYCGFLLSLVLEIIGPYLRASIFIQSLFLAGCTLLLGGEEAAADQETGLYSTWSFSKDMATLFGAKYSTYVIAVKLQHFNYYHVTLGAGTMHGVLSEMGRWLREQKSSRMGAYRAGNGEFVLFLYNAEEETAKAFAETVRKRFSDVWNWQGMNVTVPAQVWLTQVPEKVKTEGQLAVFAEAEYNERLPRSCVYYADEMRDEERHIAVEMAVKRALEKETLEVYYQPIYDTKAGRIRSAEALVRLKDPQLGAISPEEFIGVAEQTGMVAQIGEFVFETVCGFLADGRAAHYGLEFIEVNLSTVQCMDTGLAGRLSGIAAKYNVSPSSINLEITESAVIYSEETMKQVMQALLNEGFAFSLDDFGTGRANYSYILNYPFHLVKIDKSFLWATNKSPQSRVIFENMLDLVQRLDRKVVVEGVETDAQRRMLLEHGVDYLQGYYYSKPVPEETFLDYIRGFNEKTMENTDE